MRRDGQAYRHTKIMQFKTFPFYFDKPRGGKGIT